MTLKQALRRARELLTANNIEDAPLECELLLRHTLNISRTQLYIDIDRELSPEQEETFWNLIERRLNHEPTAYITRHCEFFGIDFYIDRRALIPRSGSELLVEKALMLAGRQRPCLIAEVGTGSGAIAVSLALHLPQAKIYATDISAPALEVAAINCQRHGVGNQIELLLGNMLEPLLEPVDLVVANLPYIKDSEMNELSAEIRLFEPSLALAGGEDGMDKLRQLLSQAVDKVKPRGVMLLELGEGQAQNAALLAKRHFPGGDVELVPDLSGIDRALKISS